MSLRDIAQTTLERLRYQRRKTIGSQRDTEQHDGDD